MSHAKKTTSPKALSNNVSAPTKATAEASHSTRSQKRPEADVDNLVPAKDKNPDDMEIF